MPLELSILQRLSAQLLTARRAASRGLPGQVHLRHAALYAIDHRNGRYSSCTGTVRTRMMLRRRTGMRLTDIGSMDTDRASPPMDVISGVLLPQEIWIPQWPLRCRMFRRDGGHIRASVAALTIVIGMHAPHYPHSPTADNASCGPLGGTWNCAKWCNRFDEDLSQRVPERAALKLSKASACTCQSSSTKSSVRPAHHGGSPRERQTLDARCATDACPATVQLALFSRAFLATKQSPNTPARRRFRARFSWLAGPI